MESYEAVILGAGAWIAAIVLTVLFFMGASINRQREREALEASAPNRHDTEETQQLAA